MTIPRCKKEKALECLTLIKAGSRLMRRSFQSTAGLLNWFCYVLPLMKPHLAPFFRSAHSWCQVNKQLIVPELRRLLEILDEGFWVTKDWKSLDVCAGWQLASVNGQAIHTRRQLLDASVQCGIVKVSFWAQDTAKVRASFEVAAAARRWQRTIRQAPRVFLCRPFHDLPGVGAADASASKMSACIGGWWHHSAEAPQLEGIFWFSLTLTQKDFPDHYGLHDDLGRDIAFFEALAQLVLFVLRTEPLQNPSKLRCHGCSMKIRLRQLCDNAPSIGAINKLHSMAMPLGIVLQAIAHHASIRNASVAVSHIAGERNVWADRLSRPDLYSEFAAQLSADRQRAMDARDVRRILLCHQHL